nr:uncharacterized protein LOC127338100 [Lolium perenne]
MPSRNANSLTVSSGPVLARRILDSTNVIFGPAMQKLTPRQTRHGGASPRCRCRPRLCLFAPCVSRPRRARPRAARPRQHSAPRCPPTAGPSCARRPSTAAPDRARPGRARLAPASPGRARGRAGRAWLPASTRCRPFWRTGRGWRAPAPPRARHPLALGRALVGPSSASRPSTSSPSRTGQWLPCSASPSPASSHVKVVELMCSLGLIWLC